MSTLDGARVFLQALTSAFPPPARRAHALSLPPEGTLRVELLVGERTAEFYTLDEQDLASDPAEMVERLVAYRQQNLARIERTRAEAEATGKLVKVLP